MVQAGRSPGGATVTAAARAEVACKGCGEPFTPAPRGPNTQPQFYCTAQCRERAEYERRKARLAALPPPPERACVICGGPYRSPHPTTRTCSSQCSNASRSRSALATLDRQRAAIEASKARPKLAPPPTCPACQAAVLRDSTLAYCAARCGWSILLTASAQQRLHTAAEPAGYGSATSNDTDTDEEDEMREFDPDADDDLDDDQEEETEEETDEEADDDEEEEEEAEEEAEPDPKPARKAKAKAAPRPKRQQRATPAVCDLVLAAIRCGHRTPPALMAATRQKRTGLFRALRTLTEQGRIRKEGTYRATYHATDDAPVATVTKAAPTKTAAPSTDPLAPLLALPPAELLAALVRLRPVLAAVEAYEAAVKQARAS